MGRSLSRAAGLRVASSRWRVRLAARAEADLRGVVAWTRNSFGIAQAAVYRALIRTAIEALNGGPRPRGSRSLNYAVSDFRMLHLARPGRHVLVYRVVGGNVIEVARILHDSMDIAGHLPPDA